MSQKKICLASDNWAPAHPLVIKAIAEANEGYAPSYGSDAWTEEAGSLIQKVFKSTCKASVETNQIFFTAPASWIPMIQEKIFCYPWDAEKNEVRLIASWNTSEQDIKETRNVLSGISTHSM